jgi:hypothetical protein
MERVFHIGNRDNRRAEMGFHIKGNYQEGNLIFGGG